MFGANEDSLLITPEYLSIMTLLASLGTISYECIKWVSKEIVLVFSATTHPGFIIP